MGLDMNLYKKTYVKNWEHTLPENRHTILVKKGGKKLAHIKPERIDYIVEDVLYWRKANQIHSWFVNNVMDGADNGGEHYVSREKLDELLDICERVLEASVLVKGRVHNGTQWTKEKGHEEIYEDGKIIKDSAVAIKLLPTQSGFFFGGTDYDQYYYADVKRTAKALKKLLAESAGLELEGSFYYSASW